MRQSLFALTAAIVLGLSASAGVQALGVNVNVNIGTGDPWVDTRLVEINDYGYQHRDPFVNEMVVNYGAPRPFVTDLLVTRHWAPGDVYYACALAHSLGRPCAEVVAERERDHGRGWGVTAQRLGIKPGSPQFFALKNGVAGSYGRWGHPIGVGRDEHVRWGEIKAHKSEHGHGNGHWHGDDEQGHGHDKDRGHDRFDDNGHGKDHDHGHGHH